MFISKKDFAMPRRKRMYLPGIPFHIVQRGNNRAACFYSPQDYEYYLELLQAALKRYEVQLHCYVLMTNHVHLLMTPSDKEGISNVMKVLGSRYAQHMNRMYQRTGTMWEGRHKSSAVDGEHYLLKCYRYIELNPVTANMVSRPEEYQWSSFACNAYGVPSDIVSPHPNYLDLSHDPEMRCYYYRELFKSALSETDIHSIRLATHYSQAFGSDGFKEQIAKLNGQTPGQLHRGRPKLEMVKK